MPSFCQLHSTVVLHSTVFPHHCTAVLRVSSVFVSLQGLVPSAQLQGRIASEQKKSWAAKAVRFFLFGKPLHQCSRSPLHSLTSAPPPFSGRSIGSRGGSLYCHSAPGGGGVPPRHPPLPPPPRAVLLRLRAPRAFFCGRSPVRMLSMNSPPLPFPVLRLLRSLSTLYPGKARSDTYAAKPLRAEVDDNPNYIYSHPHRHKDHIFKTNHYICNITHSSILCNPHTPTQPT